MDLVNNMDITGVYTSDTMAFDLLFEHAGSSDSVTPRQKLIAAWDNQNSLRLAEQAQEECKGSEDLALENEGRPVSYTQQFLTLLHRANLNAAAQLFTMLNFVQCFGIAIVTGENHLTLAYLS
jgi:hypothetical protein